MSDHKGKNRELNKDKNLSESTPAPSHVHSFSANGVRLKETPTDTLEDENIFKKAQNGLKWICSQVQGQLVLDVGCNKGALSLLLAQRSQLDDSNRQIYAIDANRADIDYANELRQQLPEKTAKHLSFFHADIFSGHSALEKRHGEFDCIILRETLEELHDPTQALQLVLRYAKTGARIIIYTPFRIDTDHNSPQKLSYSLFMEVVLHHCEMQSTEVVDGFVRFVGRVRESTAERIEIHAKTLRYICEGIANGVSSISSVPSRSLIEEVNQDAKVSRENVENLLEKSIDLEKKNSFLRAKIRRLERDQEVLEARNGRLLRAQSSLSESLRYQIGDLLVSSTTSLRGVLLLLPGIIRVSAGGVQKSTHRILNRLPIFSRKFSPIVLEERAREAYGRGGVDCVTRWYEEHCDDSQISQEMLNRIMFDLLRKEHPDRSLLYAWRALSLNYDNPKLIQILSDMARYAKKRDDWEFASKVQFRLREFKERERQRTRLAQELPRPDFLDPDMNEDLEGGDSESQIDELHRFLNERYALGGRTALDKIAFLSSKISELSEARVCEEIFLCLSEAGDESAFEFGEKAFELSPSPSLAWSLIRWYRSRGAIRPQLRLVKYLDADRAHPRALSFIEGQMSLLETGLPLPEKLHTPAYPLERIRVNYVLHYSLPYLSGGYATRSHGILCALNRLGIDVEAVTRYGFPYDIKKLGLKEKGKSLEDIPQKDVVDGVVYNRLLTDKYGHAQTPLNTYLVNYSNALIDFAKQHNPTVLHAASSYFNGVATNRAAALLGIPSIYEARGLWELTRMSRMPHWEDSEFFQLQKRMETEAACGADRVVAITEGLKGELVRRGVPEEKIVVIQNGVDPSRFRPVEKDAELALELGIQNDEVVIGYVGSIVEYEGLHYLIQAAQKLDERGLNFKVLVVGDGAVFEELQELVVSCGLQEKVIFTGRVAHDDVERYYSLIDITPYPRRKSLVCDLVSPLKPFESMAMEKAVIASDVDALTEIVKDGQNGLLHRADDALHLAQVLEELITNKDLRVQLGKTSRLWIERERSWDTLSRRFSDLYEELHENYTQKSNNLLRVSNV